MGGLKAGSMIQIFFPVPWNLFHLTAPLKKQGVAKLPPLLNNFIHLFCFHICYSLAVSITASTKDG